MVGYIKQIFTKYTMTSLSKAIIISVYKKNFFKAIETAFTGFRHPRAVARFLNRKVKRCQ